MGGEKVKTELWRPPGGGVGQEPIAEEKPTRRRGLRPASTRRSPLSFEQARGLSTARDWMTDSGGCGGVAGRLARRTRHRKRKARKGTRGIPA